jgi:hypothetical protein
MLFSDAYGDFSESGIQILPQGQIVFMALLLTEDGFMGVPPAASRFEPPPVGVA